jgi:integrase
VNLQGFAIFEVAGWRVRKQPGASDWKRKSMRFPKYRKHSSRDYAIVEIGGKRISLAKFGKYQSLASKAAYRRLMAASVVEATNEEIAARIDTPSRVTVSQLIVEYMAYASTRYVKRGEPTTEVRLMQTALKPLGDRHGARRVDEISVPQVIQARDAWRAKGICRRKINQHVGRIKRVWRWGLERGLVPADNFQSISSISGLRPGEAYDPPRVVPISKDRVLAIKGKVTPPIWAMIRLQWLTGMRPGEVLTMRWCDINLEGRVWEYRPQSHKTEHHGAERVVYLGPRSQRLLKRWKCAPTEYIFSPVAGRNAFAGRGSVRGKVTRHRLRECYTTIGYSSAIRRACRKVWPAPDGLTKQQIRDWHKAHHWNPNRLRHAAATRIRARHGIEQARVLLGHRAMATTEIYAERDQRQARRIAHHLS